MRSLSLYIFSASQNLNSLLLMYWDFFLAVVDTFLDKKYQLFPVILLYLEENNSVAL